MSGKMSASLGVLALALMAGGWYVSIAGGNDTWMRIVSADEAAQIYGGVAATTCGNPSAAPVCFINCRNMCFTCTPATCSSTNTYVVAAFAKKGGFKVTGSIICDPQNTKCTDCTYSALDQSQACGP
jgi:hypothetical protein